MSKPKVHISPRGVRTTDPADILASEKGQAGIRATTALFRRLQHDEAAQRAWVQHIADLWREDAG